MNFRTVPVKRKPVSKKGGGVRLSAVTRKRKQRAAAAAPAVPMDDDAGSKISRALTIIFLIHIVAIGLIFFHQRFLDGRDGESGESSAVVTKVEVQDHQQPVTHREPVSNAPVLSSGEQPYIVRTGDNYAKIAAAQGVDEAELRAANHDVEIQSGLILRLPAKRIVAEEPPEVVAVRKQVPVDQDRGLVEAVDVTHAPRANPVRTEANAPAAAASGASYVVRKGDSVWRIANKFNVNQDALMKANGISDPRKMRTGMTLVIPQ